MWSHGSQLSIYINWQVELLKSESAPLDGWLFFIICKLIDQISGFGT
jgi:hypothetical protein